MAARYVNSQFDDYKWDAVPVARESEEFLHSLLSGVFSMINHHAQSVG